MLRFALSRKSYFGKSGNIAISSALVLPLVVASLGLGVDYGYLTLQRRELQGIADLTSIVAAADIAHREEAALNHFRGNHLTFSVETTNGFKTPDGTVVTDRTVAIKGGIATIVPGRYAADPMLGTRERFVPYAAPADAVQVRIEKQGTLHLAAMISAPPVIRVAATAASPKLATVSIGSRLAGLDAGIVNALLGEMLGATLSLRAMDYRALADADVDVQPFLRLAATRLGLTAASYDDVLSGTLTVPQLFSILQGTGNLAPTAASAVRALEIATARNRSSVQIRRFLNIDPRKSLDIGSKLNPKMAVSAFDIVTTAAAVSNGTKQVSFANVAALPGMASANIALGIGEPPATTPAHRMGGPASSVRTAQTRVAMDVTIDGLAALAGLKIKLPLYVEVAYGEGRLADITCYGGSPDNAAVAIEAVPAVADLAVGTIDPAGLTAFGNEARVQKARLVDSPLLRIDGSAHVDAKSLRPERLVFSPTEVAAKAVRTASANGIVASSTQSLVDNLEVDLKLFSVTLGTPAAVRTALSQSLSAAAPSLDALLSNLLMTLGLRIGEADLRVTDVTCQRPVLVQ